MGVDKGIMDAIHEHKKKIQGPHFLFSADNPMHPHKNELKLPHEKVLHHLKGAGYDAHEVSGHYGAPERSIVVYGVTPKHAEHLHGMASKLGQDSSIYSTGQKHEMRFHHGEGGQPKKSVFGEGTVWHNEKPGDFYTTLPGGQHHFTHNFNFDTDDSSGLGKSEKIHEDYKKKARNNVDILFRVKIKGREKLDAEIPLHMSLKIFEDMEDFTIKEVEKAVEKFGIVSPDPKEIKFKPIIFHSEDSDIDYFMLRLDGLDDSYKKFYESFGDRGTTYKKFMPHITVDENIYRRVKNQGLKPEDVEFGPLIIEEGANNEVHSFEKSEKLEKVSFKQVGATLGVVGAMAAPSKIRQAPQAAQREPASIQRPKEAAMYDHKRMLNTIAQIESASGKLTHHKPTSKGTAYGKYGLMPDTIKETIHLNPDLRQQHGRAMSLQGDDLSHYMQDNPGLEDAIADKHLKRLEHHFGDDTGKIGFAWNQGISGTYHAGPNKIGAHPYSQKVKTFYPKAK
jgi:2'-5' RNA ligase